jgi:hypothetical protein
MKIGQNGRAKKSLLVNLVEADIPGTGIGAGSVSNLPSKPTITRVSRPVGRCWLEVFIRNTDIGATGEEISGEVAQKRNGKKILESLEWRRIYWGAKSQEKIWVNNYKSEVSWGYVVKRCKRRQVFQVNESNVPSSWTLRKQKYK